MATKRTRSLTAALGHARDAKKQLSAEADRLNATFLQLEKELRSLQLGVRARVVVDSGKGPNEPPWTEYLVFTKSDGSWQLVIEHDWNGDLEGTTHITAASLEVRKKASGCLEELVSALCEQVAAQVQEVRAASDEVDRVLGLVRGQ